MPAATPKPPPTDNESDDGLSDSEELDLSLDGALDSKFTQAQLKVLHAAKPEYKEATPALKAEVSNRVAETFMTEIQATGRRLKRQEKRALTRLVRKWFSQRSRKRQRVPMWGIKWNKRQTFYKQNMPLVAARQKKLYDAAIEQLVAAEDEKEEAKAKEVAEVDMDCVGEEAELDEVLPAEARKLTPFFFFQRALTEELALLDDEELDMYQRLAEEWNERGPSSDERKRFAEKDAIRATREFHTTMWTHMGVRMFTFLAYEDIVDEVVVSMEDTSKQLGLNSFKSDFRPAIRACNIFRLWKRFVNMEFQEEDLHVPLRGRCKPLLSLEVNDFKDPLIPDPDDKVKGWARWEYLPHLIRTLVTMFVALASGKLKEHVHVKWGLIGKDIRTYINIDYVPDDMIHLFREPSSLKVKQCLTLLRHWYKRQEEGLIAFAFDQYIDDDGEAAPSRPRVYVGKSSASRTNKPKVNPVLSDNSAEHGSGPLSKGRKHHAVSNKKTGKTKAQNKQSNKAKSKARPDDEDQYALSVISAALGVTEEELSASIVRPKAKRVKTKHRSKVIVSGTSPSSVATPSIGYIDDYPSLATQAALSGIGKHNINLVRAQSISTPLKAPSETPTLQGDSGTSISANGALKPFGESASHLSHHYEEDKPASISRPTSPSISTTHAALTDISHTLPTGSLDDIWNTLNPSAKAHLLKLADVVDAPIEETIEGRKVGDVVGSIVKIEVVEISPKAPPVSDDQDDEHMGTSHARDIPPSPSSSSTIPASPTTVKVPRIAEHVRLAQEAENHMYWALKDSEAPRARKSTQRYDPSK